MEQHGKSTLVSGAGPRMHLLQLLLPPYLLCIGNSKNCLLQVFLLLFIFKCIFLLKYTIPVEKKVVHMLPLKVQQLKLVFLLIKYCNSKAVFPNFCGKTRAGSIYTQKQFVWHLPKSHACWSDPCSPYPGIHLGTGTRVNWLWTPILLWKVIIHFP